MPYTMPQFKKDNANIVVGASETDTVISNLISLSDEDSTAFNVDITTSGTYVTVVAKLQDRASNSADWVDNKTVTITGAGTDTISLLPDNGTDTSGDRAFLPLRPQVQVVISTGAGAAVTVTDVRVSRRRSR